MIEIEKGKYLKINENCYLCNLCISEDNMCYTYAIAINSLPQYFEDHGYEIYGFGSTIEAALFMALGHLTNSALKGIPIDNLAGIYVEDFMKSVIEGKGSIASSEQKVIYTDKNGREFFANVLIEGENCHAYLI